MHSHQSKMTRIYNTGHNVCQQKYNFSGHQKPNMICFSLKKYIANAENIATRIAINIHNSLKLPVFPFSLTCLLGIALVPPSIMVLEGLAAVLRRDTSFDGSSTCLYTCGRGDLFFECFCTCSSS